MIESVIAIAVTGASSLVAVVAALRAWLVSRRHHELQIRFIQHGQVNEIRIQGDITPHQLEEIIKALRFEGAADTSGELSSTDLRELPSSDKD